MGYSVYLQKFEGGKPAFAPFEDVASILRRHGSVDIVGSRIEFTPRGDDLCEVGFLGGSESAGVDSIAFERPIGSERFRKLLFEVLARTDIAADLAVGLLEQCASGEVTIVQSMAEFAKHCTV